MNSQINQPDILSALKNTKPVKEIKPERKMVVTSTVEKGWDKIRASQEYPEKPVDKWNRHDLRRYINQQYFEKTGTPHPYSAKYVLALSALNDIEACLEARLQQTCTNAVIKDYIDYFNENLLMSIMTNYRISYDTMKFNPYINAYVEYVKRQKEMSAVAVKVVSNEIEISKIEMDKACKIGRGYFISVFGLALAFEYVLNIKELSRPAAIEYMVDAVKRCKAAGDMEIAINVTKKYGYPAWFDLSVVDEVLRSAGCNALALQSTNTDDFQFLRSSK